MFTYFYYRFFFSHFFLWFCNYTMVSWCCISLDHDHSLAQHFLFFLITETLFIVHFYRGSTGLFQLYGLLQHSVNGLFAKFRTGINFYCFFFGCGFLECFEEKTSKFRGTQIKNTALVGCCYNLLHFLATKM